MKKVFLYLSAFIILFGFASKGFSAIHGSISQTFSRTSSNNVSTMSYDGNDEVVDGGGSGGGYNPGGGTLYCPPGDPNYCYTVVAQNGLNLTKEVNCCEAGYTSRQSTPICDQEKVPYEYTPAQLLYSGYITSTNDLTQAGLTEHCCVQTRTATNQTTVYCKDKPIPMCDFSTAYDVASYPNRLFNTAHCTENTCLSPYDDRYLEEEYCVIKDEYKNELVECGDANYPASLATPIYSALNSSNNLYGPCLYTNCQNNTDETCAGWQIFKEDAICENLRDTKNDELTNGGRWIITSSDNDSTKCVKKTDKTKATISLVCEGQYTKGQCEQEKNGIIDGDACTEFRNYNPSLDLYKCKCDENYKTLEEWTLDKGTEYIVKEGATPCIADCTPENAGSCEKYSEDDITPQFVCEENFVQNYSTYNTVESPETFPNCDHTGEIGGSLQSCTYKDNDDNNANNVYKMCKIDLTDNIEDEMFECNLASGKFYLFFDENISEKDEAFESGENEVEGFHFSQCYYTCITNETEKKYCVGWQELDSDKICENILNNGYNGTSETEGKFYTNKVDNDAPTTLRCASKKDFYYRPVKLYQTCEGYYSENYCKDTLHGTPNKETSCEVSFNEELNSIINNQTVNKHLGIDSITAYECNCSKEYKLLSDLGLTSDDLKGKDIAPTYVCNLECDGGIANTNCTKYHQQVAIDFGKNCKQLQSELKAQGYNVFYINAESPCGKNETCQMDPSDLENKGLCVEENSSKLVDIYWGLQYYRPNANVYCAKMTNAKFTEIQTDTTEIGTYIDSWGIPYSVNNGPCLCNYNDGADGYEYISKTDWRDNISQNDTAINHRFDTTTYIDDSVSGFCVIDPFTNVSQNETYPTLADDDNALDYSLDNPSTENVVRPEEKLYMFDAIKCKPDYKEDNKDWCAKNPNISFGWFDNVSAITYSCEDIFSIGDKRDNDYCDAENLLSTFVKANRNYASAIDIPDVKYKNYLLSCPKLEDVFEKAGYNAAYHTSKPTDAETYITCYDEDSLEEKYIKTCTKDYKKCDEQGFVGDETSGTCDFYGTTLYKQCRYENCAHPSANTAILEIPLDDISIKGDFGPDINIKQCYDAKDNTDKIQVTCNSDTHTLTCEYPYVPKDQSTNWCRIADSGTLNKNSPKKYSGTNQSDCILKFSTCGVELSDGENRITPISNDTFLAVTASVADCHKNYGTAAKTEQCREPNSSAVKYNCYFNKKDYIYTTKNCSVGHDLTIPYVIINGVKHWNRCDCALPYKYHFGNCTGGTLHGNKCVQEQIDQQFISIRNDSTLHLGDTNIEFYTGCKNSGVPETCINNPDGDWADCKYCCPSNMKATGKTKQINGKKKYQCVCK